MKTIMKIKPPTKLEESGARAQSSPGGAKGRWYTII